MKGRARHKWSFLCQSPKLFKYVLRLNHFIFPLCVFAGLLNVEKANLFERSSPFIKKNIYCLLMKASRVNYKMIRKFLSIDKNILTSMLKEKDSSY